jgi:uncharacterized protein YuzE
VVLNDHPVVSTVHVDELVMVDLDEAGEPVSVEFAAPPSETERALLHERFPQFKDLPALRSLV